MLPAIVFAVAGLAKVMNPLETARFLHRALEWDLVSSLWLAKSLGWGEVALSLALAWFCGRSLVAPRIAIGVLAFFLGVLLQVNTSSPDAASCGCYGGLFGGLLSKHQWLQVGIDLALVGCLLVHIHLSGTISSAPTITSESQGPSHAAESV